VEAVLDTVRATVRRHAMLADGEHVLIAVSGGADSTALLSLLQTLAPDYRLRLSALHVDHRLRPDSSRDAEHARALGARLGVRVDVSTVTVSSHGSPEDAARRARYTALEAHAERIGADRIAVGHTADDQAETVLMRVIEGTGLRGLAGIPPTRGRIIRPLLDVRRQALKAYLGTIALGWIEDPTNRDVRFLRNRIRHDLLPFLATAHAGDLSATLARVAREARQAVDTLERVAADALERLVTTDGEALVLARSAMAVLPPLIAADVLRQAAVRLGCRGPLRAWAHHGLRRMLAVPPPRRPFRLGAVTFEVSGDRVRIGVRPPGHVEPRVLRVPGVTRLPEIGLQIEARHVDAAGYVLPRERERVAFDADALAMPLHVRGRRRGDRFRPFPEPGERRLKTFLIDAKVPRWDRDRLPLVQSAREIVWVGGLRRGGEAPVTAATRHIVELTVKSLAD
jgi:tRNA(Ile)-lysidine synthase